MLGKWLPDAIPERYMGRKRQPEVPGGSDWRNSKRGCWSLSLGERGRRVRVFQRQPGGLFFRETWIEGRGRNSASLHTQHKEEAQRRAVAFYLALTEGREPRPQPDLTLEGL